MHHCARSYCVISTQAFLEMNTEESAQTMVSYYSSVTPVIRNHPIYMQYSNHKELKTDNSPNQVVSTNCITLGIQSRAITQYKWLFNNWWCVLVLCPLNSHREHKRHCRRWMQSRQEACLWALLMEQAWEVRALCWESLLKTSSIQLLLMSFTRY